MLDNIKTMNGVELRGYEMRCGIYVLTVVDAIHGERTAVFDSNMSLSDALIGLADLVDQGFINFSREYSMRVNNRKTEE